MIVIFAIRGLAMVGKVGTTRKIENADAVGAVIFYGLMIVGVIELAR